MPCCGKELHYLRVKRVLTRAFWQYGCAVGRYPWAFILFPLLVLGGLGAGLVRMEFVEHTEEIYMARDGRAFKDRAKIQKLFPDTSENSYDPFELSEDELLGIVIFKANRNQSIYDSPVLSEIRQVIDVIKYNVTSSVEGETISYEDVCGRRSSQCTVTGERLVSPQFDAMRKLGIATYPKWKLPNNETVDFSFELADSDANMSRVGVVRVTFKLQHTRKREALAWENAFIEYMLRLRPSNMDVAFSTSESFRQELYKGMQADWYLVAFTLGIMVLYTCVLTANGDFVSSRLLLSFAGLLCTALGVLCAAGVLSLSGVKLVHTIPVITFLVHALGVNYMLLFLSSWNQTLDTEDQELDVPNYLGAIMAKVGLGITVSSLTSSIAFSLGYLSSSLVVANFCIFAGVAVLTNYICTMTFFAGCLATHVHRLFASRHCLTCRTTKPRKQLQKEGWLLCPALICGGSIPRIIRQVENPLERLPRTILSKFTSSWTARIVAILWLLAYIAVSVYGSMSLQQGFEMKELVPQSSYYYKYLAWDSKYYGLSFSVAFIWEGNVISAEQVEKMLKLIQKAKEDENIVDEFERCWLRNLDSSVYKSGAVNENITLEQVDKLLNKSSAYTGDIVLGQAGNGIVASRCHVLSTKISDQKSGSYLMERMRKLADKSGLHVFAFNPYFIHYEQYLSILPNTLQILGIAITVLCAICIILLPHPIMIAMMVLNVFLVFLGVFGFMSFWEISVSFVTINHLILCMGFSIYFSVQVCSVYFMSDFITSMQGAKNTIAIVASPIFNGNILSILGLLIFLRTESYVFDTFFKIMLLVLLFSFLHAFIFTPAILSLIGDLFDKSCSPKLKQQLHFSKPLQNPTENMLCQNEVGDNLDMRQLSSNLNNKSGQDKINILPEQYNMKEVNIIQNDRNVSKGDKELRYDMNAHHHLGHDVSNLTDEVELYCHCPSGPPNYVQILSTSDSKGAAFNPGQAFSSNMCEKQSSRKLAKDIHPITNNNLKTSNTEGKLFTVSMSNSYEHCSQDLNASQENIQQMMCMLSKRGSLGSSQAYVSMDMYL